MFDLTIEARISAAHAIVIGGRREAVHGHDWHITVTISGPTLDAEGLLCDFHAAEGALREVIAPFQNRNFNEVPPFDRANPTAENIARYFAEQLGGRLRPILSTGAALTALRITEAPGCAAVYRPA